MNINENNMTGFMYGRQIQPQPKPKSHWLLKLFLIMLFAGALGFQQWRIMLLENKVESMRYVYVYDLEKTLNGVKLNDINREFEAKINILNEEVSSAQDKISSLKDAEVKDNFADVYLKSLKLKRDTMIQEYSRTLQNLTDEINEKMTELANEKGAAIILDTNLVAAQTPLVIDVTDEIIKRINFTRPRILDE